MKRPIRNTTIIADTILINLAFLLAYYVRYVWQWLRPAQVIDPYAGYIPQQILFTVILLAAFWQARVWWRYRGEGLIEEISRVAFGTAAGFSLITTITYMVQPFANSRLLLIWALVFIFLFLAIFRVVRRWILIYRYRRGMGVDKTVVIGSGEIGRGVIRTLLARPDLGFNTIGYLKDDTSTDSIGLGRIKYLGELSNFASVIEAHPDLHTAFIALPSAAQHLVPELTALCLQNNVRTQVVPDLLQLSLHQVDSSTMAGVPVLSIREDKISKTSQRVKRAIDIVAIALAAPFLLLPTALLALAIRLESPGPIFFTQERVGKGGQPFPIYKFRSMVQNAEELKKELMDQNEASGPIFKMKDDPRMTKTGKFIRKFSLDEIPQFYNVWKGDMSLVGPRPPLASEVAEYKPWHMRRLEVVGGISGLWQVSGRSDLTFDEQCLLDIYYIENWSLALDLRIMLQTVPYMIAASGAY